MATLVAPAGDGGVLLQPTWPWPGLAETARDLIARWPAHVRAMREPARLEICGNARGAERASWVVTGHQPIVVHPGIWFRFAVLHELTRCGAHGLEVVVDTDEASPIQIRLPSIEPTPLDTHDARLA